MMPKQPYFTLMLPALRLPAAELPAAAPGAERHSGRQRNRREFSQGVLLKLWLPVRKSEFRLYAMCVLTRMLSC
jgi:hypothetical protein